MEIFAITKIAIIRATANVLSYIWLPAAWHERIAKYMAKSVRGITGDALGLTSEELETRRRWKATRIG
jgi:hypothetical protein